jgi:arabinose-5-phosphate isomerase
MKHVIAFTPMTDGGWTMAGMADVIRAERDALDRFAAAMPPAMEQAALDLATTSLPVVCMGVGKSGLVAAKVAATMASLGTPAFAVSPGDAAHGDLGAVMRGSVVLMFSNSGTTAELMRLIPALKGRGCRLIGLIGRDVSPLGDAADVLIPACVEAEADHIGMAPTTSTTLHLAVGDALAVAASQLRGFGREDFLKSHPAGQLGQRVLPVSGLMRQGARVPVVAPDATLADVAGDFNRHDGRGGRCGGDRTLLGLIVDGDIRRAVAARADLYTERADAVMRRDPVVLSHDALMGDALDVMRAHGGFPFCP